MPNGQKTAVSDLIHLIGAAMTVMLHTVGLTYNKSNSQLYQYLALARICVRHDTGQNLPTCQAVRRPNQHKVDFSIINSRLRHIASLIWAN